jgi:hypothetical protein
MKRYFTSTLTAVLFTISMTFVSTGANAQTLFSTPSMGSNISALMSQLNNGRNQQAANMFRACAIRPGACRGLAAQQALNFAMQSAQRQAQLRARQRRQAGQTSCAVNGGHAYWNSNTQQNECSKR